MLINFSNHPSSLWEQKQLNKAHEFGEIVDLCFPEVNPSLDDCHIDLLAQKCIHKIEQIINNQTDNHETVVHIMGELTLCFKIITVLKKNNITCLASTSSRNVIEKNNQKIAFFDFVQFRKY